MAIRTALGATRSILVRQLAAEGVLVACLAGALGLLGAGAAVRIVPASPLGQALHVPRLTLDHRAMAWTLGISCLTAMLVALVPALTAGVRPWASAAAGGERTVTGTAGARRLRQVLVVAQFAIAIVLLVAAGLLIRSWLRLGLVDPGFEPHRVLSLQLSTPASWSPARRLLFYDSVLERVRALPAVIAAGTIGDLFVADGTEVTMAADTGAASAPHIVKLRRDEVSPGLFDAIGAPIVEGRAFSSADGPHGAQVAVINRALAGRLWPGQSPVGRQFKLGADPSRLDWFTVVGVIGDMHRDGLEDVPPAQMFEPLAQNPSRLETLLVHTSREDPLEVTSSIEHAVHAVDAQVPVYDAATLDARLGSFLDPRRVQTALVIGFAGVALLMTWLGLYGLVQYAVATRRREIAIRMAVGARGGQILGMIVREGLRLSLVGLGIGLLGALAIGQAGASLLFEVSPHDPMTFSVVASLLTLLAVVASYVPARRAARIQAVAALRAE
jgi:predicted permease